MFNTCKEAITYIEGKRTKRTFLQFQETIKKYNIPISLPYTIHIAGTNGKGSTVQFVREILMQHGYQVGTFTSPYMIQHNDRICINGKPISDVSLLFYINKLETIIEKEQLSMFEIDVLIMLLYFHDNHLDFCVIETGIGGKTDKTNVINSNISVITNIGFDHQEMLGNTLNEIAIQKAGIIKKNQVFITSEDNNELLSIFSKICDKHNTKMEVVKKEEGKQFVYENNNYILNTDSSYQIYNAKLAVAITNKCIKTNANKVQQAITNFQYPGRFERIGNIYLDGAHNIDGIRALKQSIDNLKSSSIVIIFSALSDKDSSSMLQLLKDYPTFPASFDDDRSKSQAPNYQDVLKQIDKEYETIVITGSLHFISEVRKHLKDNV
ncbi:MAG: bifunctional folylpolyglutamate synthase/dihydrofolate synthase [Coprobacillaceae bacterium]